MRRPALVVLLTAAALASPAAANAAGAPTFRDRIDDSYPIENFCDSGVTVQAHERTIAVGWETDTTFKLSFNSRTTFSFGDQSVSDHWAGRVFSFVTEGESFESPHTELVTENGLRAYLRAPGGGTVTRDAGNLQYLLTFGEGGEFLGVEVIKDAGGHPAFYEPVWCNAALELLGIPAS